MGGAERRKKKKNEKNIKIREKLLGNKSDENKK